MFVGNEWWFNWPEGFRFDHEYRLMALFTLLISSFMNVYIALSISTQRRQTVSSRKW